MSWPHRTSLSYLIQIMEDILSHSSNVKCHRKSSRPVLHQFSLGYKLDLMCPSWCTRSLSLSKSFKRKMKTRSFLLSVSSDLAGSLRRSQAGNSKMTGGFNFIYQLARRENGCIITSLVPLPPIISPLLNKQLKPD